MWDVFAIITVARLTFLVFSLVIAIIKLIESSFIQAAASTQVNETQ